MPLEMLTNTYLPAQAAVKVPQDVAFRPWRLSCQKDDQNRRRADRQNKQQHELPYYLRCPVLRLATAATSVTCYWT